MLTCSPDDDALARVGRALADTHRQRILLALLDQPAYPSELARRLGASRSNISNHLACLRGCGLIVAEWQGRSVRYELADPHLARALRELIDVVAVGQPSTVPMPAHTVGQADVGRAAAR